MFTLQFLWQELQSGAHAAFRVLVPKPTDRVPITWRTYPITLLYFIPLTFMAYLARRPNTHLIRLLMLPTVIVCSLYSCFGYAFMDPRMNVYNWAEGLLGIASIGKALDLAYPKEGLLKVGEIRPGVMKTPAVAVKDKVAWTNGHANGTAHLPNTHRPFNSTLPLWFQDAWEAIVAMRGIGWHFGKGVHIPRNTRPQERYAFLRATLLSFVLNYCGIDFVESCLKLIPGVGSPFGGSIFPADATSPLHRYAISTFAHVLTGIAVLTGFSMVYDLNTMIGVGLLGHQPSSWPPVTDNPWISQSLHEFWAKRWHQLLRQTFLVYGGYPGYFLGGNVGLLFGTFLGSGMFHECSMYAMGHGWDWHPIIFFQIQALALALERLWRKVTGRRVCGWLGTLWVYLDIMVVGQILVNSWHKRGLAGGIVIPPFLSPTRLILFPLILYFRGR